MIIPNLELAGAEVMCANLVSGLKKNDIEVLLISMYDKKTVLTNRLIEKGIRVKFLNKKLGIDLKMFFSLKKIFDIERPDVVHTHLDCVKYASVAAWLSRVPVCVHTVHNVAEKEATGIAQRFNSYAFKHLSTVPVALSPEVQKSISKVYGISESRIPIIYNGIDLSKCIAKNTYETNELTFVHVGRFSEQKNHKMIIEAFKIFSEEYPETKLWLIGQGELFDKIQNQVNELNLQDKVIFWGLRDDVLDVIYKADVFLLPSIYEGVPMSIIEAMGTGLPVIATNVGGIPSMLDENSGILIDCCVNSLFNAMKKMENMSLRETLGRNALCKVQGDFSLEAMTDAYQKVYQGLLENLE